MAEKLFFDVKLNGASETIKQLSTIENELKRVAEAKKTEKKQTAELKAQEVMLRTEKKRLNAELNKQTREFNANKNAVKAASGSYEQLTERNKALVVQLKRIADPLGKGKKRFNELSREINGNTDKLKKMDAAMGRSFRNVGDYGGAIKKVGAQVAKYAAAIGGALIAMRGFINLAKESIDLFDKQVRAEVSLEVALGKTSKALLDQASALQQVTRFGDEATIQGQAFLAQMGLEEDAILKLTPAILDMAQAKGMDLRSAFDLVAKSVGSSTNALSRYGIEITGVAGSSERVDNAIAALNEKFEGQAEAATAGAGKLVQFDNAVGDLKETLGEIIVDGIEPFIDTALIFVTALDRLIEGSDDYADSLENVNEQSVKLTEEQLKAFNRLTIFQEEFNKAQKKAFSERRDLTQEDISDINKTTDAVVKSEEEKQKAKKKTAKVDEKERKKQKRELDKWLNEVFNLELEHQKQKIDSEQAYWDIIAENRNLAFENELNAFNEKEQRRQAITSQTENAINNQKVQLAQQTSDAIFNIASNGITNRTQAELDGLKLQREQGVISEEQFEAQSLAVKKRAFRKQKALNIAEIGMNLALELSAIARNAMLNPANAVTGGLAGLSQIATLQALAVARAGLNSAIVLSQKFAKGGLVDGGMFEGKSHAEGGVKFASGGKIMEAEGGEAIINKRSTAMFKPLLSAINTAGGGKKFALGGITPDAQLMTGGITEAGIGAEVAKQIQNVKVINVVSETTAQQNSISNVESEAIF